MSRKKPDLPPEHIQPPLFQISPDLHRKNEGGEKAKKQPTAAWARCPLHVGNGRSTGLVLSRRGPFKHYIWIPHSYMTWAGVSAACRASGVAMCVCPPEDGRLRVFVKAADRSTDSGHRKAECPHGGIS